MSKLTGKTAEKLKDSQDLLVSYGTTIKTDSSRRRFEAVACKKKRGK